MDTSTELPTAELLLDVRTPAELAFSPDGSRLAFALHATVADVGSFVPSDLYVAGGRGRRAASSSSRAARGATGRPPGRPTARAWRSSRIGSRRGTSSRTRCPPTAASRRSPPRCVGSAESVAWSSDGDRLLVLAADPGSYGLDWSARAVNGADADARSDRAPARRRPAAALPDRPRVGRRRRGRSARPQRVGGRLGRRRHRRRDRVARSLRIGLVPGGGRPTGSRGAHGPHAVRTRRGRWRVWRSHPMRVAPWSSRGTRATTACSPAASMRDRPRDRRGDRPVAGPADGGAGVVVRRRVALVRAHRRDRERLRPDLAGRSARGAVARRRVHRRRRDHARLRDHRGRRRRVDHAPGARTAAGARALRSRERARGRGSRRSTTTSSRGGCSPTSARSGGRARTASRSRVC